MYLSLVGILNKNASHISSCQNNLASIEEIIIMSINSLKTLNFDGRKLFFSFALNRVKSFNVNRKFWQLLLLKVHPKFPANMN